MARNPDRGSECHPLRVLEPHVLDFRQAGIKVGKKRFLGENKTILC